MIVTTNPPFENWPEVLGSQRLTGAALDRLTHRCHIIETKSESFRLKDAKRRSNDLRRAFATVVGRNLDSRTLQVMMRHKDFSTTQRYINMRYQMSGVVDQLEAPDLTPTLKIARP